jgi:hypothetical protein
VTFSHHPDLRSIRPAIGTLVLAENSVLLPLCGQNPFEKNTKPERLRPATGSVISPSGHNLSAMGGINEQNKFIKIMRKSKQLSYYFLFFMV